MRESGCLVSLATIGPKSEDVKSSVERVLSTQAVDVVVAGPLTTCTRHLAKLEVPVVGLSWGFDLHEMTAARVESDHAWMSELAGLIVDSESTRAIAYTYGVRPHSVELIPWGVDLAAFEPAGSRAAHPSLPDDATVVLSARAHEPLYRVGDIVEAFEIGRGLWGEDVYLVVMNEGPLTPDLQAAAGDHTLFIGRTREKDLAAWLRRSDVYVSASETDGSSVTLLQAMACGTPALVSDIPGNREWIRDGVSGRLFPVGDIQALTMKLAEVLVSPDRSSSAAKALAEVRARADWSHNSPRLGALLRRVTGLPPDE
jgi:glycosyltransferase involved in cell wall biosynthesis